MAALRHYLLALQFFTRIPVTGRLASWVGYSPAMLNASAGHFPGVGWVVGAAGAAVLWLAALRLPAGAL
ncbi:MAG TPA: adenosylcobinamide-GDP ribazoletransferase, partial [Ottowia sp.]|nr:adenosylcobinamide-GDP ribazoletransferase [Ottowia sp.]